MAGSVLTCPFGRPLIVVFVFFSMNYHLLIIPPATRRVYTASTASHVNEGNPLRVWNERTVRFMWFGFVRGVWGGWVDGRHVYKCSGNSCSVMFIVEVIVEWE